ncbi:hypothetical protein CCP4SC76_5690001 [Gammaproteobacteria bacterium]
MTSKPNKSILGLLGFSAATYQELATRSDDLAHVGNWMKRLLMAEHNAMKSTSWTWPAKEFHPTTN